MPLPIYLIAAVDEYNGIGKDGVMPWRLRGDMIFFQEKTLKTENSDKKNAVIMGKNTWGSIPEKHRPLLDRKNIVLSRDIHFFLKNAEVDLSLEEAIQNCFQDENIEKIFIIGGGMVYKEVVIRSDITGIYITKLHKTFDCDTFFPDIPKYFKNIQKLGSQEEDGIKYEFLLYTR